METRRLEAREALALGIVEAEAAWPGSFDLKPIGKAGRTMEAGQAAEQEYMAVVKPGTVAILVTPQDGTEQVTFISQTAVRVTEHRAPEGYVLALGDVPYFPPGTPDMLIPMDGLLDVEEHVDELCQANRSM